MRCLGVDELSRDDFPLGSEQLEPRADATLTPMQRDTFGGILGLSAAVNYHPLLDAAASGFCNCVSLNENFH